MMPTLRMDPWSTEQGASFEAFDDPEAQVPEVDDAVELAEWAPIRPVAPAAPEPCVFIDGVRRIDARLFAEEGGLYCPGLAGGWAIGAAWTGPRCTVEPIRVERMLVLGGGMVHPELTAQVGDTDLQYRFVGVEGITPADPLQALQNGMRRAEADLAAELAATEGRELLVLDGPLTYFDGAMPVLGLVKRQQVPYVSPSRMAVAAALRPGERTPLFRILGQRLERWACYVRLAATRPIDGSLTGVVRLEAPGRLPLASARGLADRAASTLPGLAPAYGRDPRAPQNLLPVGQLESVLRHRLGDPLLIRRALETALWRSHA